jgi:tetratricopeptide (TPR) repeat protein
MKKHSFPIIIIILCVLLCACKQNKSFSDDEYLAFINQLMQDLYQENPHSINQSVNIDAFAERILEKEPAFDKKKLTQFLQTHFKPGNTMLEFITEGADIRFIRFYRQNDTAHAVFRTYYNGGISVEDWEFGQKDGQITINDAFSVVSGIHWSDDWHIKACNNFNIVTDYTILIDQLMEINAMISKGEYEKADSAFFWIEQACKNNLYGRTMQLNLTSLHLSYAEMQEVALNFLKTFPQHKHISEFYLLQSAIVNGLSDKVDQHVANLNPLLGNDPIYFVYQSWALNHAKRLDESLQMLDSAILYMPQVYDFYHNKLDLYYETGKYTELIKQLYSIDSIFAPTDKDVPFFENNYPELRKMKEFNEWKSNRLLTQNTY